MPTPVTAPNPPQELKLAFSTAMDAIKRKPRETAALVVLYLILQLGISLGLAKIFPIPALPESSGGVGTMPDSAALGAWMEAALPSYLVMMVVGLVITAMKTISYTMMAAGNFTLREMFEGALYRLKDVLLVTVVKTILIFFGLICFILPGLFLMIRFSMVEVDTLMRRSKLGDALSNSYNLTAGRGLAIGFLLMLLLTPNAMLGGGESGIGLMISLLFLLIGEICTLILCATLYFWWRIATRSEG